MPVAQSVVNAADWEQALADVAAAVAQEKGVDAPVQAAASNDQAQAIAKALLSGERKAILLGNAAAHHAQASSLLALANWIGAQTGATVGYLTEAANTVGAQWVKAQPQRGGLNAGQMLAAGGLKAALLLNTEPAFDAAGGARGLDGAQMVVTLSPFKANMDISDVLLPIAPFSETPGTFVNAEGLIQSFHAVVRPLDDTRPGWKVLRVLANLLDVPGMAYETAQEVLAEIAQGASQVPAESLNNAALAPVAVRREAMVEPVVASIYQLDGLVRRAASLQLTADARAVASLARDGGAA
jgi:NADH-quinone oxidoreductase subunit G